MNGILTFPTKNAVGDITLTAADQERIRQSFIVLADWKRSHPGTNLNDPPLFFDTITGANINAQAIAYRDQILKYDSLSGPYAQPDNQLALMAVNNNAGSNTSKYLMVGLVLAAGYFFFFHRK